MENAQAHTTERVEQLGRPAAQPTSSRHIPRPVEEGLECLRELSVPFAVLHADTTGLDERPYLDLYIDPSEHKIAFAALRRAGYREMNARMRFAAARVFVRHDNGRFFALVIRSEFVHAGVRYMDAGLARQRFDLRHALPLLGPEDRFLHVLVSSLLQKREPTESEKVALRKLRREGLDRTRLAEQTRPVGLEAEIVRTLQDLELYLWDPKQWKRLGKRVRRALCKIPENKRGAWRHWKADNLRWSFEPVVLAVVGPAGSGCSSFARALERHLERSPLNATYVRMGSWNSAGLLAAVLKRLAPARLSWGRLFRAAIGRHAHLPESERRYLATRKPKAWTLGLRALFHGARNLMFHGVLLALLYVRYFRRIARSRAPVVIADGWIYDLGFRPEHMPYTHGARLRRWVYHRFPIPDGILYASTSFEQASRFDAQLGRESYEAAHRGLRRLLEPQEPLELVADGPPDQMATTFLRRYWAHLLQRYNRHT